MGKISFPPKGSAATVKKDDSFTPTVQFLPNEEKHSCVICSQFVEDADAGKPSSSQNAEVTLQAVFKYVAYTGF
jgi:hypothetical protein